MLMRLNILLFAGGVWLLQQQAELPDIQMILLLGALCAAVFLPVPRTVPAQCARRIVVLAACCATGYAWAAVMASVRLADALPAEWEGRDIRVEGVIAGLPQPAERSVRFEFDVERVLSDGAIVPGHIVLSWWATSDALPQLTPGERWQLTVRLRRPRGLANPHGFDYEAWLFERNLRATGQVRPRASSVRIERMVHRPQYWVERARALLRARILSALPDEPYVGVLVALAVGDQRAIPSDQWQVYTRTGVNHLMSIC